ncbi:ras GTPase-activating-like protein IQGAP1 isoform X2 [Phymastichus coffea]|uniref:ras GTPase-activating-like protein IQGAP1 isoform X2 n=1 Tax=Phymastichus coffea TaxID=108790 RepID=UPI00273C7FC7|nr:ras GTPase-activating-like protein IQGAP1 isoform X2 [Phymastichus coffea]
MKTKDIAQLLVHTNEEVKSGQRTAEEMDQIRQKTLAYEYLCHLEEAKKWLEACLREKLPPTTELEENLRNGVYLAKLGHFIAPDILPLNKIYDIEQKRYTLAGLQFRHTDNINHFLKCLKSMHLPFTFQPETTDIYDKKNMPRLIYCIHALSTHLFKLGKAPQIQDLYGKVNFTDEEIDAVSKELKKMGIQMPAFQKIGGLLTNSMSGDTAALHAAVIAINQSLTSQDQNSLSNQLQNSAVRLKNINPDYINFYFIELFAAKERKEQAALNRSLNDSYVSDAYDELLTQAEIQGHINNVNMQCAFELLTDAVCQTMKNVASALQNPALKLQCVSYDNDEVYRRELRPLITSWEWENRTTDNCQYWQSKLQEIVHSSNDSAKKSKKREEAVKYLNQVLQIGTEQEFHNALLNPKLGISHLVDEFAVPLYYEEMKIDRIESKADLTHSDIIVSIRVLTAIANITKSIDTNDPDLIYEALSNQDAHVANLEEDNKVKYLRALAAVRHEKQLTEEICPLLTFIDVQECVDLVNEQCFEDNKVVDVINSLNIAVKKNSRSEMMEALEHITIKLEKSTSPDDASLYLKLFTKRLTEKHSDGSELWLEDVEQILQTVLDESESVQHACTTLSQINEGLEKDHYNFTIDCLQAANLQLSEKHMVQCYEALKALRKIKKERYSCNYVQFITPGGNEAFIDMVNCSYTWDHIKNVTESQYVTKKDIEDVIRDITIAEASLEINKDFEKLLIRLQACVRGYLIRMKLANCLDKVVKIQAWWRGQLQRRAYAKILERRLRSSAEAVCNYVKVKAKYQRTMDYYKQQEHKIIKIQALWRGRSARRAFDSLLRMDKPPFSIVRHFSGILNFNAEDYDKDLQLQQLKNDVVQLIKHNQKLSYQLNNMDIKIGLLIQNRVTLQDVVAHGKNLENLTKDKELHQRIRHNSMSCESYSTYKGLKSLTKEGRRMLEGYQHLFYSLQTNPIYLSKLLFLLPQSKSNKFVHNVIMTLFNFGSNSREEYLFLKLLSTALEDEIRGKLQKPSEVITATPMVLKMAVNYAKQVNGSRSLREILGPTIEKILNDKSISIETNPVDIYKCWRNQLEMEKGEASDLPYHVTEQHALQYVDVQKRLSKSIRILQTTVLEFLNKITSSRDLIPYGMLYMAKVLYRTLSEKFPDTPEKEILKVVGNLVYYHFINAAIVAPDAFDIITLPMKMTLSNDQRRNLASIAKILQFATSKKGFDEEATHLVCLNSFIIQCHEKFKKFFRYCCQVEELDDHFNMHEYAEATLIHMPEIVISLQEICDTHCLLLNYQYHIAPNPMDSLHELLDDLGNAPTVATLLGLPDNVSEIDIARLGKTEVNLVLSNKFEVPVSNDSSLSRLFIKTKELLVSVLKYLKGDSLVDALSTSSSPIQEKLYSVKTLSITQHKSLSLDDCKLQLQAYLDKLEMGGWVSREDGYQTIVTAVAKDLCNKGRYRVARNKELAMLRGTKQRLEEKSNYYMEQVEYYSMYIKQCLANLNTGKGTLRTHKDNHKNNHVKLKSNMTLKYSAARLHDKGILVEITGLSKSQFKNVMFEITPTDNDGIFTVRGKFMGVEMEKVDVDVTKLLELQYEGSPIMNMFGKARINVNLLLYLLNRKFYGKK